MYGISISYFTFYLFGRGCVRTQCTPLPMGLDYNSQQEHQRLISWHCLHRGDSSCCHDDDEDCKHTQLCRMQHMAHNWLCSGKSTGLVNSAGCRFKSQSIHFYHAMLCQCGTSTSYGSVTETIWEYYPSHIHTQPFNGPLSGTTRVSC